MEAKYVNNMGHVDLYVDGEFICSNDTLTEAEEEFDKYCKVTNREQKEINKRR